MVKENWQKVQEKSSDAQWYFTQVLLFWCCLRLPDVMKGLLQRSQRWLFRFACAVCWCCFKKPDLIKVAPHWPHLYCFKAHLCASSSAEFAHVRLQRLQPNHLFAVDGSDSEASISVGAAAFSQMTALRLGAMSLVIAEILDWARSLCGRWEGCFWSNCSDVALEGLMVKSGSLLVSSGGSTAISSEWSPPEGKVSEQSSLLGRAVGPAAFSGAGSAFSPSLLCLWWCCRCLVRSLHCLKHFRHIAQANGRNLSCTANLCLLSDVLLLKAFPQSEQSNGVESPSAADLFTVGVSSTPSGRLLFSPDSLISSGAVALLFSDLWVTLSSSVLVLWFAASVSLILACFLWTLWCLVRPDAWLKLRLHCGQQ